STPRSSVSGDGATNGPQEKRSSMPSIPSLRTPRPGDSTMQTEDILAVANEKNIVAAWDDAHRYTPAPRHRRRLILQMLHGLDFADCLDTGCAQPFLLQEIMQRHEVAGFGCDISDRVMAENQHILPEAEFHVVDLANQAWPNGRVFDL